MASSNLSGSLGPPQNAVAAIGNIITNTTTAGTMVSAGNMNAAGTMVTLPAQQQVAQQMQQPIQQQQQLQPTQLQPQTQQQAQVQQQQSIGTGIDTPMEIDSGTQTVVAVGTVQQPNISCSPGPSLGNLQSVVGPGINNAITTASALTTALHNSTASVAAPLQTSSSTIGTQVKSAPANAAISNIALDSQNQILTKPRLQDLVREVDPTEQLDEEVEELLLQLADDFVETTIGSACLLAKHRRAPTIDVKDVQLHLERTWNMWIPGFGTDEIRPYKRASVTEAHKQRLALIRKALKKY